MSIVMTTCMKGGTKILSFGRLLHCLMIFKNSFTVWGTVRGFSSLGMCVFQRAAFNLSLNIRRRRPSIPISDAKAYDAL